MASKRHSSVVAAYKIAPYGKIDVYFTWIHSEGPENGFYDLYTEDGDHLNEAHTLYVDELEGVPSSRFVREYISAFVDD